MVVRLRVQGGPALGISRDGQQLYEGIKAAYPLSAIDLAIDLDSTREVAPAQQPVLPPSTCTARTAAGYARRGHAPWMHIGELHQGDTDALVAPTLGTPLHSMRLLKPPSPTS